DGAFTHYLAPYTQFVSSTSRIPTIAPPWFQMTAFDLNAGTIKWQVPYGTVPSLTEQNHGPTGVIGQRGGPVVTAGGLFSSATNDKKFRAYDQDTGKVIWER